MNNLKHSVRTFRYAELRCKTNFSFLCGASHPDELAARAAELGYAALAVTDVNSLAGVVRAHTAAKEAGLKLVIGAEITPEDAPAVLLYATDLKAYGRLSRLITRGRRAAAKGECRLSFEDVAGHAEGLLAAVAGRADHGSESVDRVPRLCQPWEVRETARGVAACGPRADVKSSNTADTAVARQMASTAVAHREVGRYREVFGDRCHLAVGLHRGPEDDRELGHFIDIARRAGVPLVAVNDVHYHEPGRRMLHDVLTAVRYRTTVAELGARRFPNGERYLKPPAEMAELFHRYPRALAHALELAERCRFSLDELRYEYPEELCPPGMTATEHLARLTRAGARERYPHGVPAKVSELLQRELRLIEELRYEAYFLTVWDLVRFARGRGILCQGRGSAANSAVCYCLGVTAVDPDRTDLLFERFVSREREEAPDIDIDFEHERREEVLQYVYEKYGRDRAGITAEVITYRPRSAVRDVGKALGLSPDRVDRLAKLLGFHGVDGDLAERAREAGLDPEAPSVRQLVALAAELLGFPRHLSQHVGGFVITRGPLSEVVPIENAAMPGRTVIEWDKNDLDELGILKVDCLGLGMLTAIQKSFELIQRHHGVGAGTGKGDGTSKIKVPSPFPAPAPPLSLATIPAEDPAVYEMIGRADTVGVFQIESRAQMSMLPRLVPRCFYDLVIEVAIVRPGPIQGGMVHPYLRRRNGEEPVTYPDPVVEQVLHRTLGVPLFQEQVMRLAMVAAGFTAGEADKLRRAMGAWRRPGLIEQFRTRLRDGMLARGLPAAFADQIFEQIRGFGEYGFPESHAASFALLAYASAWLKYHYPAAFTAALLNSQPMGFYAPAQLVRDAREHGVEVRPVDVNHSDLDCTLEPTPAGPAVRLGFRLVKGFPTARAEALVEARRTRPFSSVADFARRARPGRPLAARLAAAGAFGSLGLDRRESLWHALCANEELPLFAGLDEHDLPAPPLPVMPLEERIVTDYDSVGLSLEAHPMSLVRPELDRLNAVPASAVAEAAHAAAVRVAGLVLVRQRPATAKGTVFITLEDETGTVNLVLWPRVWQRYRRAVQGAAAVLVHGRVERAGKVVHVMVGRVENLTESLGGIAPRSRDFR